MGMKDEIKNAVNWNAPAVDAAESMRTAIRKMAANHASALAVTSDGKVVGVLTDMDLMMAVDGNNDLDATRAAGCMTACELLQGQAVKSPCAQLDSSQTVENALGVMNKAGVHHLVISDPEKDRIGVVSIVDLLKQAIS